MSAFSSTKSKQANMLYSWKIQVWTLYVIFATTTTHMTIPKITEVTSHKSHTLGWTSNHTKTDQTHTNNTLHVTTKHHHPQSNKANRTTGHGGHGVPMVLSIDSCLASSTPMRMVSSVWLSPVPNCEPFFNWARTAQHSEAADSGSTACRAYLQRLREKQLHSNPWV